MTSGAYAEAQQWHPIPPEQRKWESSQQPIQAEQAPPSWDTIHTCSSAQDQTLEGDTSEHAAAERERPPAPRLKEDHIWGVREDWGERAGTWGKGAAVFQERNKTKLEP